MENSLWNSPDPFEIKFDRALVDERFVLLCYAVAVRTVAVRDVAVVFDTAAAVYTAPVSVVLVSVGDIV